MLEEKPREPEAAMAERNWSDFACPNPSCPAFGQRGLPSIRPHGWSSKAKGIRCLRCTACGKSFSERRGTPFFRCQLAEDQLVAIAHHIVEGNGMRPTSRLCGVSLNTVLRIAVRAGQHTEAFHDQKVRGVHPRVVQGDEAWAFVGKKRQAL
jgi:transposase-like protein